MAQAFVDQLNQYEQYLRVEKNLSEKTRKAYLYDLNRFAAHLGAASGSEDAGETPKAKARSGAKADAAEGATEGKKRAKSAKAEAEEARERLARLVAAAPPPAKVSADHIREYLNHLQSDRGLRGATLARTIASIRIFFDFLVRRGLIEASPAAQIHNPKLPRKLPVYLVMGELTKLLQAPDRSTPGGVRDFAILVTMAFAGTRLSELTGLNARDVNLEHRSIRVTGKGSKERVIPMNELVRSALEDHLRLRAPDAPPALFLSRFGRRIANRTVEAMVRRHAMKAGVFKDRLSPHKLRHTFATLLHSKDVDILEIQALLGHASITSTQIYTHTSSARLQAAVEKLEGL